MHALRRTILCAVFCGFAAVVPGQTLAQGTQGATGIEDDCGDPFQNAYGPFDYRTATQAQKVLVESNHFTRPVETLQSGLTGTPGHDIGYTLRAFPNHPRALLAMVRLAQRDKTKKP